MLSESLYAGSSRANPLVIEEDSHVQSTVPPLLSPKGTPVKPVSHRRESFRRVIEELSTSGELELSDDSTGESDSEQVEQKPLKRIIEKDSTDEDEDSGERELTEESTTSDGVTENKFMANDNCPVYETPPDKYPAERIIKILLDPTIKKSKICHQQPANITKSSTYVVDLNSLKDPEDVKKDNFGVWNHNGSHLQSFECCFGKDGKVHVGRDLFQEPGLQWETFSLRRLHSKHPSNSSFRRMLCFITDSKDTPHHHCLLVYRIPKGFIPVSLPHGNSKSKMPYFPTWPSTMKMIKSEMKHSGPKEVVSSVSIKVGGVLKAAAPGELPRGERQVINAKRTLRFKSEDVDELFVVMQKAKAEDTYVRDIKTSPDPAIVIASDRQLDDLVRFCAPPAGIESCIMTVDPTFSLGEFECTPVTYRQLLVQTRRGKVSPVFLGPILIHYRKNFPTFLHFAASLVSLRKELQCIRVFGTDGEKALVDAFSHEFRFSIHLYCSIHVRNNVKKNLRERKFTEEKVNKITDEIFGKKIGSTYCEGLVDAGSEEVFYQQLEDKQLHWEELEKECPGCIPGFFDWFKEHLYEVIISGMLRPLREDAGLGVPPSAFSTNASESVNAMLKRKVDYKKNELPNFIQHLKEVIDEQQREIERAVIRRGKYEFKEEYRFLEVDESKWFQMTKQQREKHMKKVADTSLKGYELDVCTESKPSSLSITAEECHSGDHKVPLASIQGIWKKAEELLAQPNAVVTAPGFDASVKMVASKSGKRPHLVKSGKGGRVSCDSDCPNWRSLNICSHTVAVAETNNCLPQYIDFYRKSKHLPSITQLVLTGLPTGIGKKGNRISRKRKNTEVTDRIPVSTASSVPSTIATSHSRVGFSTNTHLVITTTTDSDSTPAIPSVSPVCYQFNRPDIHSPLSDTSYIPTPLSGTPYIPTPYFPFAMQPHQPLMNFNNRGGGNIRVHSATQCITPPPYWPAGQTNWPSDQSDADVDPSAKFRLCFRTGNISVCNGCRNKFDKKAAPPNDLCVQHAEWRTYTSPVTSQPESRYGNAYYHANPSCIIHKWPTFHPGALEIPSDILHLLKAEHKRIISSLFGITLH